MTDTRLTISSLPTLPDTADTILFAGWLSDLTGSGASFPIISDTGGFGIVASVQSASGNTFWGMSGYGELGTVFSMSTEIFGVDLTSGNHSYAISIDTTNQHIQILMDGTLFDYPSASIDVTWYSSDPIAFFPGSDSWAIGQVFASPGSLILGDFRFGAGEGFFDLSIPENVAKLFTTDNKPVYWGDNGELVTGLVPAVYLHGDAATYADNLGSAGPFTIEGIITDESEICEGSSPPPPACSWDWTTHTDLGENIWETASISNDGTKMIAGAAGFQSSAIVSSDSGTSWSSIDLPSGIYINGFKALVLSGDGSTLYLASGAPGNQDLYQSIDFGGTWGSNLSPSGAGAPAVIVSGDGQHLLRGGGSTPQTHAFMSLDGGTTWIDLTDTSPSFPIVSDVQWEPLSISDDGDTMLFSHFTEGTRISNDSGDTWSATSDYLTSAAISSDGFTIVISSSSFSNPKLSIDGGATFNDLPNPSAGSYVWSALSISGDGRIISGRASLDSGPTTLYISCDRGNTWLLQLSSLATGTAANQLSGDGNTIIVAPGFTAPYILTGIHT